MIAPLTAALLFSLALLPAARCPAQTAGRFELTAEQRARLEKYIPHTLAKMLTKAPVHTLVVGDGVMAMNVHNEDDGNTVKSFEGVFLSCLADQFYYTGGLRVVRPGRGAPEKAADIYGPEMSVHNASRGPKLMIHAMNILSAVGWEEDPDLVMVGFGLNDAISGQSLASYRRAVEEVIATAKAHNADLILVGPTPTLTEPAEAGLSLTRAYADTMREVAEAHGVFFADMGDIAWLVRVDEPLKDVERPLPKKKTEETDPAKPKEKEQKEAPTPGALINFPMPTELDPDPEKRALRLFNQVAGYLHGWFDHGGGNFDPLRPNSSLHRLLGRRLFTELLDGPRKTPWSLGVARAEIKSDKEVLVSFRVENTTDAPLRVNFLPLVTRFWKPQEAEAQVELLPARKALVTVSYSLTGPAGAAFPSHESFLRLPIMVLGAGYARIEDTRAALVPCGVVWDVGAQFNKDKEFTLTGRIANNSLDSLEGTWDAEWNGQKLSGKFSAASKATAPLALAFKLPPSGPEAVPVRAPLTFTVKAGNVTLNANRDIEAIPNAGLKRPVPLLPDPSPATIKGANVTFHADADPSALYLIWDISGVNLADQPDGTAIQADLHLDARSYGKRLGRGVTDVIHITSAAADGDARVLNIQPWCFGNGYGVGKYDTRGAQARLTSRPDGTRRLTLMLPRAFFPLHEWAIGNGNSQMGYSTSLFIWQRPDDKNPSGSMPSFSATFNTLHHDDAESLAALEFTDRPTARWAVHFY